jgi:hypothetical protein
LSDSRKEMTDFGVDIDNANTSFKRGIHFLKDKANLELDNFTTRHLSLLPQDKRPFLNELVAYIKANVIDRPAQELEKGLDTAVQLSKVHLGNEIDLGVVRRPAKQTPVPSQTLVVDEPSRKKRPLTIAELHPILTEAK